MDSEVVPEACLSVSPVSSAGFPDAKHCSSPTSHFHQLHEKPGTVRVFVCRSWKLTPVLLMLPFISSSLLFFTRTFGALNSYTSLPLSLYRFLSLQYHSQHTPMDFLDHGAGYRIGKTTVRLTYSWLGSLNNLFSGMDRQWSFF